ISPEPMLIHFSNRCIGCGACVERCPQKTITLQDGLIQKSNQCDLCGQCEQVCTAQAWEITGKHVTAQSVLEQVMQDRPFYEESGGGVTFSGGEPLQQVDFLETCLLLCKTGGLHTAVDTAGHIPFISLQRIAPVTGLFLFDIKTLNEQSHQIFTGQPNRRILENFVRLASIARQILVRVPVIPGFNDRLEDIQSIGRFVKENTHVRRIDLLPYHRLAYEKYKRLQTPYTLSHLPNLTAADVEPLRLSLIQMGFESVTGG
ncbi:MAG: glycyl-radical enzyme activating protein, partial [Anaerolineaceae bacterium]